MKRHVRLAAAMVAVRVVAWRFQKASNHRTIIAIINKRVDYLQPRGHRT